jgi:alanine racemase
MTHFRSADELSSELFWQLQQWQIVKQKIINKLNSLNLPIPRFHSQNSAATFRQNSYDDFVRIGIAMYGYLENAPTLNQPPLKPVLSLWADKISQRKVTKADKIGYGGAGEIDSDLIISTYDIGYGDGFYRLLPSHNYILSDGKKIIGKVSMDSFSYQSNKETICVMDDAKYLGKIYNTFSYDVLVKLSSTIKREVENV